MPKQCQARGRAGVAVMEEAAQVATLEVVMEEATQVATLTVVKVTMVAETLAHRSIVGLGTSEVGIKMWRAITT